MNKDLIIHELASILEDSNSKQRVIGELLLNIDYPLKALTEELKENHGIEESYNTLRTYRYVWKKVRDFNPPEDISFNVLRWIATTPEEDRPKYFKMIGDGVSSAQVVSLIRKGKGIKKRTKVVSCPQCSYEWDINNEEEKEVNSNKEG